ncbi:ROK family transcriptional regulator [Embleya scabrispora]|uniref:ROK family transcriptional regulator n=1 Tax=Embleya scabrispora TaxID=159449 RepID=UPI00047606D2|nr:ROK family transcriptional regulator [Embleya scabrispora]MYS80609.1 ROK family protein [Streptomyces sp. SID5474]
MPPRPENRHQARLLGLLRDNGPQSRAELGDGVHMSRSKLAIEVDRLTELGLVEPAGLAASRGGRRSGIVRLSPGMRFIGVDIGATSIDVAVTNGELEVLGHLTEQCDVRIGPEEVLDRVFALVDKLREVDPFPQVHGVGIGVPGPVSFREGMPVIPPIMPGWDRFPIRDVVGRRLGCPVLVDNDVNIMALGELHSGVARSIDDFLLIKIGTGIGCGIVVGGEIYRGVSGSAGDIGHIRLDDTGPMCVCGNAGCLEAYFSGAALAREARAVADSGASPFLVHRLADNGTLTGRDVADAAAAGDPAAVAIVREGGMRVGRVIAALVSFLNPGLLIIGGGVAGLGHPLLAEIRSVVYRQSLPLATGNLPIVLSELGGTAGVIGAARLISDHVLTAH